MRSEVQVLPGPPFDERCLGAIAQLGERVLCKHEVVGSIPSGSTSRDERIGNGEWRIAAAFAVRSGWRGQVRYKSVSRDASAFRVGIDESDQRRFIRPLFSVLRRPVIDIVKRKHIRSGRNTVDGIWKRGERSSVLCSPSSVLRPPSISVVGLA